MLSKKHIILKGFTRWGELGTKRPNSSYQRRIRNYYHVQIEVPKQVKVEYSILFILVSSEQ
jgi:hypothetical protein